EPVSPPSVEGYFFGGRRPERALGGPLWRPCDPSLPLGRCATDTTAPYGNCFDWVVLAMRTGVPRSTPGWMLPTPSRAANPARSPRCSSIQLLNRSHRARASASGSATPSTRTASVSLGEVTTSPYTSGTASAREDHLATGAATKIDHRGLGPAGH